MLVLSLLAMDAISSVRGNATVSVATKLVKAATISASEWEVGGRRSQRVYTERDGRRILLRTVDHE